MSLNFQSKTFNSLWIRKQVRAITLEMQQSTSSQSATVSFARPICYQKTPTKIAINWSSMSFQWRTQATWHEGVYRRPSGTLLLFCMAKRMPAAVTSDETTPQQLKVHYRPYRSRNYAMKVKSRFYNSYLLDRSNCNRFKILCIKKERTRKTRSCIFQRQKIRPNWHEVIYVGLVFDLRNI